jgi:hypothetical protein
MNLCDIIIVYNCRQQPALLDTAANYDNYPVCAAHFSGDSPFHQLPQSIAGSHSDAAQNYLKYSTFSVAAFISILNFREAP